MDVAIRPLKNNKYKQMRIILSVLFFCVSAFAFAQIELPQLFSNDMILQRNKPIPVWGWSSANEKIVIRFNNQIVKTKANKKGEWKVSLKSEVAGGPYTLSVKGNNTIILNNVLVGEVWICSGQSNMEFTVSNAMNFDEELKDTNYPMIRHFLVEKDMGSKPKLKLKSSLSVCIEKAKLSNLLSLKLIKNGIVFLLCLMLILKLLKRTQ